MALVMGTRDYIMKSGFSRVILGLSGGIDSALTACIATDALGPENVLVVTMPSRYSSAGSVEDSNLLAKNLGVEVWTIPIEPAHQAYLDVLEPTGEPDRNGARHLDGDRDLWVQHGLNPVPRPAPGTRGRDQHQRPLRRKR